MNVKDTGNGQYVYDITLKETAVPSALKHLRRGRTASSIDSISDSAENNNRKKYAIALEETTAPGALKHLRLGRTASSIDSITDSEAKGKGGGSPRVRQPDKGKQIQVWK